MKKGSVFGPLPIDFTTMLQAGCIFTSNLPAYAIDIEKRGIKMFRLW